MTIGSWSECYANASLNIQNRTVTLCQAKSIYCTDYSLKHNPGDVFNVMRLCRTETDSSQEMGMIGAICFVGALSLIFAVGCLWKCGCFYRRPVLPTN